MKHWVITGTIDPSKLEGVVSGRDYGNIMFVSYSRAQRKWFWVIPGRGEKEISQPLMIFLDEDWARENRNLGYSPAQPRSRKKKVEQLEFSL